MEGIETGQQIKPEEELAKIELERLEKTVKVLQDEKKMRDVEISKMKADYEEKMKSLSEQEKSLRDSISQQRRMGINMANIYPRDMCAKKIGITPETFERYYVENPRIFLIEGFSITESKLTPIAESMRKDDIQWEKGATIRKYLNDLEDFFNRNKRIETISKEDIDEYGKLAMEFSNIMKKTDKYLKNHVDAFDLVCVQESIILWYLDKYLQNPAEQKPTDPVIEKTATTEEAAEDNDGDEIEPENLGDEQKVEEPKKDEAPSLMPKQKVKGKGR